MKAISLWQPWASLIEIGAKQIETRSWHTSYRGLLVIHATKRKVESEQLAEAIYKLLPSDANYLHTYQPGTFYYHAIKALYEFHNKRLGAFIPKLTLGAALCTVELVDCVPVEQVGTLSDEERVFGNYSPGRYAWILKDVERFDAPVPINGAQGLWNYDYINSSESTAVGLRRLRSERGNQK